MKVYNRRRSLLRLSLYHLRIQLMRFGHAAFYGRSHVCGIQKIKLMAILISVSLAKTEIQPQVSLFLFLFYFYFFPVPEYDIAVPYESNEHGHFVSHRLHEKRSRRSTDSGDGVSFYKMDAFGKTLHLKLTQNNEFMAPGLMAETRHKDGTIKAVPVTKKHFFLGKLTSDPDSLVAVSRDEGLVRTESHVSWKELIH